MRPSAQVARGLQNSAALSDRCQNVHKVQLKSDLQWTGLFKFKK